MLFLQEAYTCADDQVKLKQNFYFYHSITSISISSNFIPSHYIKVKYRLEVFLLLHGAYCEQFRILKAAKLISTFAFNLKNKLTADFLKARYDRISSQVKFLRLNLVIIRGAVVTRVCSIYRCFLDKWSCFICFCGDCTFAELPGKLCCSVQLTL